MSERILVVVRHGQLDMQAYARDPATAGLTAMGREQARRTARHLRALDIDALHCSILQRARETAAIFGEEFGMTPRPSKLLRELPNLEAREDEAGAKVFLEALKRADEAFFKYVRPARGTPRLEILVSHGNLIRYLACRTLGLAPESWRALGFSHCGISRFSITSPDNIRLLSYNETGHLPHRLRS